MVSKAEPLDAVLTRLKKPIRYAVQENFTNLMKVRGLAVFVGRQVQTALSQSPPEEERESWMALMNLFTDYEQLSQQERQDRLRKADALLYRLSRRPPGPSFPKGVPLGATASTISWDQPVQYLKGVGPKRAEGLLRLGIRTLEDLLYFLPWRYEDRSHLRPVAQLRLGEEQTICAVVQSTHLTITSRRRFKIFEMVVGDETGSIRVKWFNQPYLQKVFKNGQKLMLTGKVKVNRYSGHGLEIENPVYEIISSSPDDENASPGLHTGRIVPIYHETHGWTSRMIRSLMNSALDRYAPAIPEILPSSIRASYGFLRLPEALVMVHFPSIESGGRCGREEKGSSHAPRTPALSALGGPAEPVAPFESGGRCGKEEKGSSHAPRTPALAPAEPVAPLPGTSLELLNQGRSEAHGRLVFDEFLLLQLGLGLKRREVSQEPKGTAFRTDGPYLRRFLGGLPYQLTRGQKAVLEEIRQDMARPHPMNRLLQGDVGCGKTVVAVAAMMIAADNNHQAALMAPTEILAEQHYLTVKQWVRPFGLKCHLLTGGQSKRELSKMLDAIASGEPLFVIGTHALIQEGVRFGRLGLVVVDEQHKFGVMQRAILRKKGYHPDMLIMTATPIPRTLALTVHGDLDLSVIAELPKGRASIETLPYSESKRSRAYALLAEQIAEGRQAYIVYPLVDESEKMDLKAAVKMADHLQQEAFPSWKIGLLHGQMSTDEKERVMQEFKERRIQILVATSVIEVGIDVPNATVMIIEHAERFGLSQLHQLRGRVGRGSDRSYCLLMTAASLSAEAKRRLDTMVRSRDGFVIAEEDLAIRGPGEFFGIRQSGIPELRVANILRDGQLLEQARREAWGILETDPQLSNPQNAILKAALVRKWSGKLELFTVS